MVNVLAPASVTLTSASSWGPLPHTHSSKAKQMGVQCRVTHKDIGSCDCRRCFALDEFSYSSSSFRCLPPCHVFAQPIRVIARLSRSKRRKSLSFRSFHLAGAQTVLIKISVAMKKLQERLASDCGQKKGSCDYINLYRFIIYFINFNKFLVRQ